MMYQHLKKLKTDKNFSPTKILDIGANVGQFATEMRSIFGNAHIYSIEANPYCEAKLGKKQSNGHLNEYQIVALGKEEGELDFYYSERKPAGKGASFYPEIQGKDLQSMQVPVRRLDDVLPEQLNRFNNLAWARNLPILCRTCSDKYLIDRHETLLSMDEADVAIRCNLVTITDEKMIFLKAISNVIKSGMDIVGVSVPEKM